jgi:putative membrane protein
MHGLQRLLGAALVTLAAAVATSAQAKSDEAFMKDAAQAGAAEVEASRLAQSKARTPDVKAFAAAMIADHTKVADELKALAAAKNVKLPDGPSVKQKAELKLIDAGDDDKFDERYAKHFGVQAHQETIKLFEEAAREAKDADVKAWAAKTLPGLRHHLQMAERLSVAPKK